MGPLITYNVLENGYSKSTGIDQNTSKDTTTTIIDNLLAQADANQEQMMNNAVSLRSIIPVHELDIFTFSDQEFTDIKNGENPSAILPNEYEPIESAEKSHSVGFTAIGIVRSVLEIIMQIVIFLIRILLFPIAI